jgi:aconitate hydratase
VFKGDDKWREIDAGGGLTYSWPSTSTYVQNPPYFKGMGPEKGVIEDIEGARILALMGDSVTTDHISPAGSFKPDTPAGEYLIERQVQPRDFNSFGARRGNHEVMMRGTFANIRIRNEMLDGVEGGFSKGPDGTQMPIYDAAMAYHDAGIPLIVVAGKEYGTGSSRDWAAKGPALLGLKAVIAESFERIHRSNLVGMGVVPLQFTGDDNRKSLGLTGDEVISITGLAGDLKPGQTVKATITYKDGTVKEIDLLCRIDTEVEIEYVENGGVLHYVLRHLAAA